MDIRPQGFFLLDTQGPIIPTKLMIPLSFQHLMRYHPFHNIVKNRTCLLIIETFTC